MNMNRILVTPVILFAFVFSGCATSPSRGIVCAKRECPNATRQVVAASNSPDSTRNPVSGTAATAVAQTQLVAHQEEVPEPHVHAEQTVPPVVPVEEHAALTLEQLEAMAMANNPTLAQANAQFQAEQGAAFQAGLPFNPVLGYTSEQIGVNGTAGETQGGYVAQEIVTGGKLRLSRAKWAKRRKSRRPSRRLNNNAYSMTSGRSSIEHSPRNRSLRFTEGSSPTAKITSKLTKKC